jgi:hypothetical protein
MPPFGCNDSADPAVLSNLPQGSQPGHGDRQDEARDGSGPVDGFAYYGMQSEEDDDPGRDLYAPAAHRCVFYEYVCMHIR